MKKSLCITAALIAVLIPAFFTAAYAQSCPQCTAEMTLVNDGSGSAPSCLHGGTLCYYCPECQSNHYLESGALGHNYIWSNLKKASCEDEGIREYTCLRCGDKYETKLPAGEHDFTEELTEPGCDKDGQRTLTCSICGEVRTELLPATGHKYSGSKKEIKPTCTKDGQLSYVCTVCGETVVETTPAVGHDYRDAVEDATCTQTGLRIRTCSVCRDKVTEAIPAKGHSYGEWTTARKPTVFYEGDSVRICSVCGNAEHKTIAKTGLLDSPVILIAAGVAAAAGASALIALRRPKRKKAKGKGMSTGTSLKRRPSPTPSPTPMPPPPSPVKKTVLFLLEPSRHNLRLKSELEGKPGLSVITSPFDGSGRSAKPSLILFFAASDFELMERTKRLHEEYPDAGLCVAAGDDIGDELLESMVRYRHLSAFFREGDSSKSTAAVIIAS